jgi:hypothetical protein
MPYKNKEVEFALSAAELREVLPIYFDSHILPISMNPWNQTIVCDAHIPRRRNIKLVWTAGKFS